MRILILAVLCVLLCTAALQAQTPAAVTIVSGNGQLTCQLCIYYEFLSYDPLVVLVTDANGNPLNNTAVTWTVTAGNAYFGQSGGVSNITTYTNSSGISSVQIGQTSAQQSGAQFGLQSTITATAGGVTATFYETQAAPALNQSQAVVDVVPNYNNAPYSTGISGVAGSAGQSFTMGIYTNTGTGVPNISLMLVNEDNSVGPSSTVPSAYCKTQAGAGYYTALSDETGTATCNVEFGPVANQGTFKIVTGGSISATTGNPPDYAFESQSVPLSVSAPTVGAVKVVSGNNQTGLAGSALQPLVAEIVDANNNPLVGQLVTWVPSPVNSIQLNGEQSTSDSNGLVHVESPVLSTSANGTITVTATSNTNSGAVATFTLSATQPVIAASMTIQGGNNQTAVEGAAFTTPLAVLVTGSNNQPMAGVTVSFTSTGTVPITLSASSTTTTSGGLAVVNATAGLTPGSGTVVASVGATLSQTFNLTVIPPGPNLTASSFVNGADGQVGSVSPCSIAAITGSAVAPGGAGLPPMVGPLQYEVATDTVTFGTGSSAIPAPIFAVSNVANQQQILILVPCELSPGTVPVTVNVNGGSQTLNVNLLPASPGIFQTTMSDGVVRAVIERPDGSFASPTNPARRGEIATAFVTGLGPATPQVASNTLPIATTPSTANGQVIVGLNAGGVPLISAQLSPDLIGVYVIQFQVPENAPQNNNVPFSIGLIPVGSTQVYYSNSNPSKIPIQ
jgi:uncharacterized protein (TIGR03437 family)